MPGSIRLEQLRNVRNQRVVRIGVRQQRANTQQNLTNRQCWTPLVLENIETNSAVRIDVTVVDACGKMDFGRLRSHNGERNKFVSKGSLFGKSHSLKNETMTFVP